MQLTKEKNFMYEFLGNLAIHNPDILIISMLKGNEFESIRHRYQKYFVEWNEIFGFIKFDDLTNSSGNDEIPLPETPEEADLPSWLLESNTNRQNELLSRIKEFINWKGFSTNGEIIWDNNTLTLFDNDIFWGINSDEKEVAYRKGLDSFQRALDTEWDAIFREEEHRFRNGGISANPFLQLSEDLLKNFEDKWDYYALCRNYELDWNAESFLFLFFKHICKRIEKKYIYISNSPHIKLRLNIFGNSYLRVCNSRDDCFYKNPDFYLFKKTIYGILSSAKETIYKWNDIMAILLPIALSTPHERDRLEFLYGYELVNPRVNRSYKILISYEPIIEMIIAMIKEMHESQINDIFNQIELRRLRKIKSMFYNNASIIKSELLRKGRGGLEVDLDDLLGTSDDSYCPICQESPCRCSDPY